MFKDTPFERTSFVRSIDFLSETQEEELTELNLINGLSISNYEVNGDSSVMYINIQRKYRSTLSIRGRSLRNLDY